MRLRVNLEVVLSFSSRHRLFPANDVERLADELACEGINSAPERSRASEGHALNLSPLEASWFLDSAC